MENQIDLLSRLRKTREEKRADLDNFIEEMEQCKGQMNRLRGSIEARRQDMLGLEGKAARAYFEAISSIMPERYRLRRSEQKSGQGRVQCPAQLWLRRTLLSGGEGLHHCGP